VVDYLLACVRLWIQTPVPQKKVGNGDHTEQAHVGLESAVEPVWLDSVCVEVPA
jgi:hypothetical protein